MNRINEFRNKSMKRLAMAFGTIMAVLSAIIVAPILFAGGGTSTVSGQVTVNNACAFTENVAGVTYGGSLGLTEGTNTLANANTVLVTNTGDAVSNILISGASANWAYLSNTFGVTNTVYASASHSYFVYPANTWSAANAANGNVIALTSTQEDSAITVNTVSGNYLYTGINIPSAQASGTYTLTINLVSSC